MWDEKTAMRPYQVFDCKTQEEFLIKYYKHERYKGRGEDYADCLLKSHQEDLRRDGVDWISRHDSITGRIVSFTRRHKNGDSEILDRKA